MLAQDLLPLHVPGAILALGAAAGRSDAALATVHVGEARLPAVGGARRRDARLPAVVLARLGDGGDARLAALDAGGRARRFLVDLLRDVAALEAVADGEHADLATRAGLVLDKVPESLLAVLLLEPAQDVLVAFVLEVLVGGEA